MNRTTKSHGVKFVLTDLHALKRRERIRALTTHLMGTDKVIVAVLHPRAIRKLARDFAAMEAGLDKQERKGVIKDRGRKRKS